MPDRVPSLLSVLLGYGEQIALSVILALVGMVVGLGQLFASQEMLTTRIIVGRALSSGGLGTVAGVVVVWIPDLSFEGQIGVAAGIASLGTSALERVFQRVIGGGK